MYISYPLVKGAYDYYECTSHSVSKGHPECEWHVRKTGHNAASRADFGRAARIFELTWNQPPDDQRSLPAVTSFAPETVDASARRSKA